MPVFKTKIKKLARIILKYIFFWSFKVYLKNGRTRAGLNIFMLSLNWLRVLLIWKILQEIENAFSKKHGHWYVSTWCIEHLWIELISFKSWKFARKPDFLNYPWQRKCINRNSEAHAKKCKNILSWRYRYYIYIYIYRSI